MERIFRKKAWPIGLHAVGSEVCPLGNLGKNTCSDRWDHKCAERVRRLLEVQK